jgi:hypothetical protein
MMDSEQHSYSKNALIPLYRNVICNSGMNDGKCATGLEVCKLKLAMGDKVWRFFWRARRSAGYG